MRTHTEQHTHARSQSTSTPEQELPSSNVLGGRRLWTTLLMALAAGSMLSGCQLVPIPKQTARLRIKAYIDGAASFYVQADTIRIKHHAYEQPGRWGGAEKPVYINGTAWQPVWDEPTVSVLKSIGFGPDTLPGHPVKVTSASYFGSLGSIEVVQQPTAENQHTLIISIDDRGPLGANWYTIDLDW